MSDVCNVPNCQRARGSAQLMCRWHWARVPVALQAEVNHTWRRYSRAANAGSDDFRAARKAYYAAREAAIKAVL